MASHGVARTSRARTPAQYQADQDKIAAYRDLDARLLAANNDSSALADPATLSLTADLLARNPEHYTAWNELGLVALMLTKDQRNFHAWGYRRHVVRTLESEALAGSTMSEAEFAYTERMISAGLSNFSAWHHRSRVIPRLLNERGLNDAERRAFLDAEFSLVRRALDVGPEDQSCWYYHQFLVLNMTEPVGKQTIAPNLGAEDKVPILQSEIDNIKDLLEDYDDDLKLAYEALMDYTPALARLEGREETETDRAELQGWLAKLRKLDPMRKGRWDDFERAHSLR
ncbi:T-complex protein 1 subunit delta [Verticillium dahliae VDG1]|nr:T-complex protein 1 subunit delta [Verticillium dahliae VDG1]